MLDTQYPFLDYKMIYNIILIPIALMKDVHLRSMENHIYSKFYNIYELEKYIQVAYLSFRSTDSVLLKKYCNTQNLILYLICVYALSDF